MHRMIIIGLGICFVLATPSFAFHDGGVAACRGCHTMHNSEDGVPIDPDHPNGNAWLLKEANPSEMCLSCHATSRGKVFWNDPLNPPPEKGAGNFTYLLEDNINDGHNGGQNPIPGHKAGHNIIAPSYGSVADPVLVTAPGGSFRSDHLACSSCHDPHGTQAFRLLYGAGRMVNDGYFLFENAAPTAEGINFSDSAPEANNYHTAYQGGMSAWCANCHGDYHNNGTALIHPSGETVGGSIADNYNMYNGTSDYEGGTQATAYLAAVPFEDASMTIESTMGPSAGSQVSCISCHRAHATSAPNAGRWDFNLTLLAEDGVESGSYAIPNPYDEHQRSLCNKCHVKDADDEGSNP
ncbi:MAG: hypothetical protein ACE15D_06755 [Candidatus Eisenbacteria bacterium]|nr:cytochrome c3 family protein [Candidatus Eisenbacteria bacterium]